MEGESRNPLYGTELYKRFRGIGYEVVESMVKGEYMLIPWDNPDQPWLGRFNMNELDAFFASHFGKCAYEGTDRATGRNVYRVAVDMNHVGSSRIGGIARKCLEAIGADVRRVEGARPGQRYALVECEGTDLTKVAFDYEAEGLVVFSRAIGEFGDNRNWYSARIVKK